MISESAKQSPVVDAVRRRLSLPIADGGWASADRSWGYAGRDRAGIRSEEKCSAGGAASLGWHRALGSSSKVRRSDLSLQQHRPSLQLSCALEGCATAVAVGVCGSLWRERSRLI